MTAEEDPPRIPIPVSIRTLLWGTDEPRLRASWRVLLSWGLLFIWSVIAALAGGLTKPYWDTLPGPAQQILNISVGTAIFLVLFALFARYIDRRPLRLRVHAFAHMARGTRHRIPRRQLGLSASCSAEPSSRRPSAVLRSRPPDGAATTRRCGRGLAILVPRSTSARGNGGVYNIL